MSEEAIAPNAKRLLLAGFMAILAAGVGFGARGGILSDWGAAFGFTQTQLGSITGGGLTGFGIIILLGALVADKVGYGKLLVTAFVMHFLSAVVMIAATPVYKSMLQSNPAGAQQAAYWMLFIGTFMFAIGNGLAEAVVNPLTATLFPKNKAHYLNVLHAGWPAGLVLGALFAAVMNSASWEVRVSIFLVPVVAYGLICLGQKFPKSEAASAGVPMGQMLAQFAAPLLLVLLVIHALLGYVELGTDSWISNITGNIVGSKQGGLYLFVYTSALMFALRFFAGPIVERISPLGLLLAGACCGALGLTLLSGAQTVAFVVISLTVYGFGKTFLWPTMLAVASERFPKGGAIVIGAMGGIGMLSAGLLGGPGIGYCQDRAASESLRENAPAIYDSYKAEGSNGFLIFKSIQGLDGSKVNPLREKAADQMTPEEKQVHESDLHGGRSALKITAAIPATMAVLYLLLILYFKATGGYKALHVSGEEETGGINGPMEA
ncbi:MAG TPA: MFS transporter [Chthoniobacter sp.]|nr:MFS transporter [Chthoniobacter sp.]